MKNLKKTLAVVLTFAMILSMGFSAFAYTDVAEGTKVSEAVGILSNLGIFTGFEDGTFKPDETVTRAQMAAIICRTLGYEDQAKSSAGSTIFNDVAADHWAAGYINVAQSLQIVNGYGDGNFGPEDQVTYEQAVKMIVVALGYELDAQAKGGWSTGYLAVASREGITKNANGTVGAPASRGTIAVLVYNSLEVRLMDQETWTTTGGQDEYSKTDETILSQYLEVEKYEGIVATTPYSDYAKNGYAEDADAMMTLDGDVFYTEYVDGKLVKNYNNPGEVDASLVPEVNALAGKKVIAYIGAEEDDTTGNRMVYAIAEKQGANKSTKISATQLVEDGDKYWAETGVIGYRNVGSTRINTLDLDTVVTVVVNYGAGTGFEVATTEDLADEYAGLGGSIELISNDANSKIDVILCTIYAEDGEAVIEAVEKEDEMITFDCYAGSLEDIDTEDEDLLTIVIKDGVITTVDAIAANDTVSIVGDLDDTFRVLYVSSKTVTGTVDSYDDDAVEIAGEEYELSPLADYDGTSDLSGKEGIFFLNVDGQIAHDEAEASKGNYAVVLAAGTTSGLGAGYEIEVVLADGTVATYPLNSKAYVEDLQTTKEDKATYDYLKTNMEEDGANAYRVEKENLVNAVYEITVKSGKVTKLVKLAKESTASGKEFDEENMSYGAVSFNEATIVISVDAADGAQIESDDITVGKVADFFVDGEGEDASILAYDEDNNDIAGLVVGFDLAATIPQDGDAIIVTSIKNKEIDNDDAYVITGLQAGKVVTYTIYDEDGDYTGDGSSFGPEDIEKGDVILVAVANAEGIVKDFELLYDANGSFVAADDASKDEYYFAGNLIKEDGDDKEAPSDSKFYLDSEDEAITMKNSANYTLVDYTDSTTNPEVSKKSKSKSIFGTLSKYDSKVFVRYYDDEIVEVVVYRTNAA